MSTNMKLLILGAVLLSDIVFGGVAVLKAVRRGALPQALIIAGTLLTGWVVMAVVFFTVL